MSWNHRQLSLWHSKVLPEATVVGVKKVLNIVSISWWTSCSQRKKGSSGRCLKLIRWQGPPNINKLTEIVLSFRVTLFIQSFKKKEFVYLVCLEVTNTVDAALSLLINILSLKLHIAPLKWLHLCGCKFLQLSGIQSVRWIIVILEYKHSAANSQQQGKKKNMIQSFCWQWICIHFEYSPFFSLPQCCFCFMCTTVLKSHRFG